MSDRFKFRQEIKKEYQKAYGSCWHYWGYVDMGFVSPLGPSQGGKSYQCTGLRDKNRTLIYEGDILETSFDYEESSPFSDGDYDDCDDYGIYIGVVHYMPSKGNVQINVRMYSVFSGEWSKRGRLDNIVQYKTKIIGTIYENPELLEKAE